MAKHNIKELSIQVHLNGLSFCILNRSLNTIEFLKDISFVRKLSPFDTLNKLKGELSSNPIFSDEFDDVLIIHRNELSTLVPAEFYDESCKADYLKFNSKILQTDFIATDDIAVNKSVNVYVPYMNINNYIFETFGTFVYKHASSILIDTILQKNPEVKTPMVFVNIGFNAMECFVFKNKGVELYNYFEFDTKEDFIYYILFVFEQLELDTETTHLELSGAIFENDEFYAMVYKYIRHVKLIDFNYKYDMSKVEDTHQKHNHYLILNSFS